MTMISLAEDSAVGWRRGGRLNTVTPVEDDGVCSDHTSVGDKDMGCKTMAPVEKVEGDAIDRNRSGQMKTVVSVSMTSVGDDAVC